MYVCIYVCVYVYMYMYMYMYEDAAFLENVIGISSDYVLAPCDQKATLDSLTAQAGRSEIGKLHHHAEELGEIFRLAAVDIPDLAKPNIEWLCAFADTMEAKAFGWSRRWRNLKRKDMWLSHQTEVLSIVYGRMVLRAVYGDQIMCMTPMERVRAGLCDPKTMSTKNESHPGAKAESKRWRQLWIVSHIDMPCISLSGKQTNDSDKNQYQSGTADHYLCGLGHIDAGIANTGKAIERLFPAGQVYTDDIQNYDFDQTPDALVMSAQARAFTLMKNKQFGMVCFCMLDQFCHLGHVMECGVELYVSRWYGQEPSGGLLTTTNNNRSRINGLRHVKVDRSCVAGGDNACWPAPFVEKFTEMFSADRGLEEG